MEGNLNNHLDKLFHDSIEPLSELPGKNSWENIERELDKNNAEKYRRKYILFKKISIVSLVLCLSFITFNLINYNKKKNEITDSKTNTKKDSRVITNNVSINNSARSAAPQNKTAAPSYLANKNKNKVHRSAGLIAQTLAGNTGKDFISIEDVELPSASKIEFDPQDMPGKPNTQTAILMRLSMYQPGITGINNIPPRNVADAVDNAGKKDNKVTRRFSITAYFAPQFAGYTLEDNQASNYENKRVIQKRETHLFSHEAGFLLGYAVSRKISLQSGVSWSSSNINIDPDKIYAVRDNSGIVKYEYNTSSGFGYILPSFSRSPSIGDSLYTRTSIHKLQFISIPVVARYKFTYEKFSLEPGVGLVFNFLTRANLKTEVNDDTESESEFITKLNGLKKISYSFLLSPDLRYQVSKKWSLVAGPYLKYALASINNESVVKTYPYNLGCSFGVMAGL